MQKYNEVCEENARYNAQVIDYELAKTDQQAEITKLRERNAELKKRLGLVWPPAEEYMEEHVADLAHKDKVIEVLNERATYLSCTKCPAEEGCKGINCKGQILKWAEAKAREAE
jgi:hypothetical protein